MPSTMPFTATATRGFSTPSTVSSTVVAVMLTGMNAKTGHASLCTNDCVLFGTNYANDGSCDDGGPDSDDDLCNYGNDCNDCGLRCDWGQIMNFAGQCSECEYPAEERRCAWCSCAACKRDGAMQFAEVAGCEITQCEPGYHLRDGGQFCDPIPECEDGQINDPTSGQCVSCPNAEEPNLAYDACTLCERPNATQFANATGCVITQCNPLYALQIRMGGQFCDPIQCGHAHEEHQGACIVCERPGAESFDEEVDGCTITGCHKGYNLTDAGTCEGTPELCYLERSGHEITAEGVCVECDVPHVVSYVAGVNGCQVDTCEAGFEVNEAKTSCVTNTPITPPTPNGINPTGLKPKPNSNPTGPTAGAEPTSRDVGNANANDEGFNPAWLAFLAVPVFLLVGICVFCAMKKKGGTVGSEDNSTKGPNTSNEGQAEALLSQPQAEVVQEVQQSNAESEDDMVMDL